MISRRSAKAIAEAYHAKFTRGYRNEFAYEKDVLYDFLYVNNFDGWILNAIKAIWTSDRRGLIEFIMRLHTGESLLPGTKDWSWEQRKVLGQRFLHDLAESLIRARHTDTKFESYGDYRRKMVDEMERQLELDGFLYREGVLLVPEESVLDEEEEQGVLDSLAESLGLSDVGTVKHHIKLSADHYRAGRWDDSISNSRKVLEAVLQQVAARHSERKAGKPLPADTLERPVKIRDYLESTGLLDKKEKEAIGTTYALLSDTGGHPYIAQQEQARLMRHLALTFSQFALLRLKGVLDERQSL